MSIIVSERGGSAQRLDPTVIPDESFLQAYLFEHPEALPLHEIKDDAQLLILSREFPTDSGPIDLLAIDQDAELYVIETKLFKNPDKRLVIAQVLDYGAALWSTYSDADRFIAKIEEVLVVGEGVGLSARLKDSFDLEDEALADYMAALRETVTDGRIRFVVLMDRIDQRLKDLIAFVNANSRFDVLGVDLELYRYGELDIVIPSLYGAEVRKETAPGGGLRRRWDEPSYLADLETRLGKRSEPVKRLYQWAREHADVITWGTGAQRGSFNVKFSAVNVKSVFTVFSDGELSLHFRWLRHLEASKWFGLRLVEELRRADLFHLPEDPLKSPHVHIELEEWGDKLDDFTQVVVRTLEALGRYQEGAT